MQTNHTDAQFEQLEETERQVTLEHIAAMLLLLGETREAVREELISFYHKYGKDGVITYNEVRKWVSLKDRRKRLNAFLAVLETDFNQLQNKLREEFGSLEIDIKRLEFEFFEIEEPEDFDFEDWGQDDSNWYDRLVDDVLLWLYYLGSDTKRAIMRADTLEQLLKQYDKRFKTMENVLTRLGMTESSAFTTLARKAIFKEFGVGKYRYYARVDERTCETCGALHDTLFDISAYEVGVTAPPIHPSCRCWTVPVWE